MTARHTTQSIAALTGGDLVGPGDLAIDSLAEIGHAHAGQLTFIGSEKYAGKWSKSGASAALVGRDLGLEPGDGKAIIRVDNADLAMAKVLEQFAPPTPLPAEGVDPSAVIATGVTLGKGVRVGPHCVLKPGVTIGDHTVLHAGVIVFNDTTIGTHCELWSGAVVRERCTVGDRCILHANAVIGADGFGYRLDTSGEAPKLVKVPQIGVVRIGNDVEIGAGTTIDRAKFDATVIGDGCKLDNLVQIGHNVVLGRMVVIAGCTGVAGSTTIGDGTMIGGQTAVSDHLTVGCMCQIAGGAAVINDIPDGEKWGGVPAKPMKEAIAAELALRKLPELMREMKRAKRQADKQAATTDE